MTRRLDLLATVYGRTGPAPDWRYGWETRPVFGMDRGTATTALTQAADLDAISRAFPVGPPPWLPVRLEAGPGVQERLATLVDLDAPTMVRTAATLLGDPTFLGGLAVVYDPEAAPGHLYVVRANGTKELVARWP